ncbi:MAG TPA: hypothetical protein VFS05_01190 [Gemmatimonadaceae bacterium]|nr:hypothetical protein [Gemmatimonadaceae bacterium]
MRRMHAPHAERRGAGAFLLAALQLAAAHLAAPSSAAAQAARGAGAAADSALGACLGGVIASVEVTRERSRTIGRWAPRWAAPTLEYLLLGEPTRESVVRDYLLLREGERCDEFRRRESERILRAQPFIAGATVRTVPDGAGGERLQIETEDEIPMQAGLRTHGVEPSYLSLGSRNVEGRGVSVAGEWTRGFAYREGFGIAATDYHAFGGPNVVSGYATRRPRGDAYGLDVGHPFLTSAQRFAWTAGVASHEDYVGFVQPRDETVSVPYERRLWGAAAIARIGTHRLAAFAGPVLARESGRARAPVFVTDSGLVAAPPSMVDGLYPDIDRTRLGAVLGVRALSFLEVTGFDALAGTQDVARGAQLATTFGAGVPWFGGADRQPFVSADLYAGAGTERTFVALRTIIEGHGAAPGSGWDDVVASGRLALYLKRRPRRTLITSLEYSGAHHSTVPYQLTLGARNGGVRGYAGSHVAGARRAVVRVENRWFLASLSRRLGVGAAAFGDVGKVWAGDVPGGTTTLLRPSIGASALFAYPPRSRRLARIDVAVPLAPDRGARALDVRFLISRPLSAFWREPDDLRGARAGAPEASLIRWP